MALLPVWYWLLMRYGTFFPLFVWTHTSLQPGSGPGGSVPPGWRPRADLRVVVSMTTLPYHLDLLQETIASLQAQTLRPDKIYINVPRGQNKRTGAAYAVPRWLARNRAVHVNRCREWGPLTKLLPTLSLEVDPATIIITVDDDKIYHSDLVRTLAWHQEQRPSLAYGLCGWSFMSVPTARGVVPVYVPWLMRGNYGRRVDVLQAVCGNAYRRSHFRSPMTPFPPACYTTDDINIAAQLLYYSAVNSVVIPHARHLEPVDPLWKQNEDSSAVSFRLSSYNLDAYSDLKCKEALRAQWGKDVFA